LVASFISAAELPGMMLAAWLFDQPGDTRARAHPPRPASNDFYCDVQGYG
jgi:hypothetical protein